MAANYVSSQLVKTIERGARRIAVEYVDRTTAWTRPQGYPSASVKSDFADVVEQNADSLNPKTTRVAMKYAL